MSHHQNQVTPGNGPPTPGYTSAVQQPGYPPQGYPPQGNPPPDYKPDANQPGNPQQGYPQQQGYPDQGYSQQAPPQPVGPYPTQAPGPYPQQGYAPPHPGYVQPGQPGYGQNTQNTVIIQPQPTTYVVGQQGFGQSPQPMKCPHCTADIVTATQTKIGNMNWMMVGGICLAGLAVSGLTWLGCQFIPLCIPSLMDVEHTCPNCHKHLGRFDRMNGR